MAFDATPPDSDHPFCPKCGVQFQPKRGNQRFCDRECQKASSKHSARVSRLVENAQRNRDHYAHAASLCYDLNRMPRWHRSAFVSRLLKAAKDGDAKLRNILTDPRLLGAERSSGIGKLYPDSRDFDVLNILKEANAYCQERWGISIRTALGDNCPVQIEEEPEVQPQGPVKETYWQRLKREGKLGGFRRQEITGNYDWRDLARVMRDPGWGRYWQVD
ncbi:hypothetical protein E4L95_15875 [Paracoccus liaowanqingii]|uniref:Uncharacterized protein n=1 Tax=Paracoccus liaowanqingii TaxID=2560053 RepID=A0A4Z1CKQ8_9RHOB|nr:hypothetical protein [Paracoccus liaowanqingii]TGN53776.1 hypothetical protein E4L95_15875 [Paracoccus liaowanqingii]